MSALLEYVLQNRYNIQQSTLTYKQHITLPTSCPCRGLFRCENFAKVRYSSKSHVVPPDLQHLEPDVDHHSHDGERPEAGVETVTTDILILGAGMAGVSAARRLAKVRLFIYLLLVYSYV